jgi:hypothetical protein
MLSSVALLSACTATHSGTSIHEPRRTGENPSSRRAQNRADDGASRATLALSFAPKPLYAEFFELGRVWSFRGESREEAGDETPKRENEEHDTFTGSCEVESVRRAGSRVVSHIERVEHDWCPLTGWWAADGAGLWSGGYDDMVGLFVEIRDDTDLASLHFKMPAEPAPGQVENDGGNATIRFEPQGEGWCSIEEEDREAATAAGVGYDTSELCLAPGVGPVSGSEESTWSETSDVMTYELVETSPPEPDER